MVGLIYRAKEYSPRDNVSKDAAILNDVGSLLQKAGESVIYVAEETLSAEFLSRLDMCVSMARRWKNLILLTRCQQNGLKVWNRPSPVQITVQSRSTTLELLQSEGLPVVPFWSYEPAEDEMFQTEEHLQSLLPGWVKAMHPRGVSDGDVMRVDTPLQADSRIMELTAYGYSDIIVTRHLEGELKKVYVVGSYCLTCSEYKDIALKVGKVLGLSIYGVDLIETESGPFIIDVNDFPSFSICREEAASKIADLVLNSKCQL